MAPQSNAPETKTEDQGLFTRIVTWGFLGVKLLVLFPLLAGVFMGIAFDYHLCKEVYELGIKLIQEEATETEAVVGLLQAVDGILLISVVVLIVFGTFWIYMIKPQAEHSLPLALQGLSSGKLKEKLSSSLITASAVYLFKIVIQLTAPEGDPAGSFSIKNAIILGSFHLLFIVGYLVIAYINHNDPHKRHAASSEDSGTVAEPAPEVVPSSNSHGQPVVSLKEH